MCVFFTLLLFGPRVAIFLWWLFDPSRWSHAFGSFIWPFLGFIFLPWTTLMFVIVAPYGNVAGWDYFWLGLAVFIDIVSWSGSGYSNRSRLGYA